MVLSQTLLNIGPGSIIFPSPKKVLYEELVTYVTYRPRRGIRGIVEDSCVELAFEWALEMTRIFSREN